jgi:hypothetical protein
MPLQRAAARREQAVTTAFRLNADPGGTNKAVVADRLQRAAARRSLVAGESLPGAA